MATSSLSSPPSVMNTTSSSSPSSHPQPDHSSIPNSTVCITNASRHYLTYVPNANPTALAPDIFHWVTHSSPSSFPSDSPNAHFSVLKYSPTAPPTPVITPESGIYVLIRFGSNPPHYIGTHQDGILRSVVQPNSFCIWAMQAFEGGYFSLTHPTKHVLITKNDSLALAPIDGASWEKMFQVHAVSSSKSISSPSVNGNSTNGNASSRSSTSSNSISSHPASPTQPSIPVQPSSIQEQGPITVKPSTSHPIDGPTITVVSSPSNPTSSPALNHSNVPHRSSLTELPDNNGIIIPGSNNTAALAHVENGLQRGVFPPGGLVSMNTPMNSSRPTSVMSAPPNLINPRPGMGPPRPTINGNGPAIFNAMPPGMVPPSQHPPSSMMAIRPGPPGMGRPPGPPGMGFGGPPNSGPGLKSPPNAGPPPPPPSSGPTAMLTTPVSFTDIRSRFVQRSSKKEPGKFVMDKLDTRKDSHLAMYFTFHKCLFPPEVNLSEPAPKPVAVKTGGNVDLNSANGSRILLQCCDTLNYLSVSQGNLTESSEPMHPTCAWEFIKLPHNPLAFLLAHPPTNHVLSISSGKPASLSLVPRSNVSMAGGFLLYIPSSLSQAVQQQLVAGQDRPWIQKAMPWIQAAGAIGGIATAGALVTNIMITNARTNHQSAPVAPVTPTVPTSSASHLQPDAPNSSSTMGHLEAGQTPSSAHEISDNHIPEGGDHHDDGSADSLAALESALHEAGNIDGSGHSIGGDGLDHDAIQQLVQDFGQVDFHGDGGSGLEDFGVSIDDDGHVHTGGHGGDDGHDGHGEGGFDHH